MDFQNLDLEQLWTTAVELISQYGLQLIGAIITLIIGLWIISRISNLFNKMLKKGNVDDSLSSFLRSLFAIILRVLLVLSIAEMVGVKTTSFIAIFGAAGLAIGMALSGTLQNFAGGVMILLFKPYKVGDFIDAQGYTGIVNEIQIFNTILKTPDNKTIIIPNGGLASGSMINYSTEGERRVDWVFGIGYGDDLDKAYEVLGRLINSDERILKDPEPFMALSELADSSVNITVRVWVKAPDYWDVYFKMNEEVYKTFDKEGLSIPFPQRDVHVYQQ